MTFSEKSNSRGINYLKILQDELKKTFGKRIRRHVFVFFSKWYANIIHFFIKISYCVFSKAIRSQNFNFVLIITRGESFWILMVRHHIFGNRGGFILSIITSSNFKPIVDDYIGENLIVSYLIKPQVLPHQKISLHMTSPPPPFCKIWKIRRGDHP